MMVAFSVAMFANSYWYRGGDNSWGATAMTVSTDGLYEYIQSSSDANQFKIAASEDSWDYGWTYVQAGFNSTDVTNIGDYGQDNCYCWQSGDYYILVYYPNTAVNTTANPIICASTTLPEAAGNADQMYVWNGIGVTTAEAAIELGGTAEAVQADDKNNIIAGASQKGNWCLKANKGFTSGAYYLGIAMTNGVNAGDTIKIAYFRTTSKNTYVLGMDFSADKASVATTYQILSQGDPQTLESNGTPADSIFIVPEGVENAKYMRIYRNTGGTGLWVAKVEVIKAAAGETPEQPEEPEQLPTVAIAGAMNGWSATANVMTAAEDSLTATATIALAAQDYEFKVVADDHWYGKDATYEITRTNPAAEGVNQEIAYGPNLVLKADVAGDYTFTWTYATSKLEVTFPAAPAQPKFYITGNEDIVGEGNPTWGKNGALESFSDTLVMNLAAGFHKFKLITPAEQWLGMEALTDTAYGLFTDDDTNICFNLAEAGAVTVIYNANEFKVEGNFYVAPVAKYYLIGDSAFVVDAGATADKAWTPDAIPSFKDTTVLNLKAGVDYIMRLSLEGTWENHRDFRHLTDTAAGLIELPDEFGNHSIGFRLNEAGPVTIIYIPAAEEQPEVFKLIGNFYVAPAPDPTVAVMGSMNNWAEEIPFVLSDDKTYASLTVENIGADNYEFKFVINGEWRSNGYTYHRGFPGAAGITENNDANMIFQADVDGEYTFYWYFANDSAAIVYPAAPVVIPAKFYITGDSALVVDAGLEADKAWAPAAMKVETDTMTLTLKAKQAYTLKITLDGDWATGRGYSSLSEKPEGITTDADDNIIFTLVENGAVNVIYVATEDTTIFKVEGNFYVAPAPDPTVAVMGSMNNWAEEIPFVLSDDKTYASLTVENIGADEYEFKFIINGEWRSNGYTYHRGFPGAAGITENNDANMVFVADQDGEYTIAWYFANDSLAITYPEYIEPAKEYYAKYAPAWEWVKLTEAEGLWLTDTIVYKGIGININDAAADENNMFYSNTVEEEGVRPIAGAEIDVNDTIYFTFNPADSVVTAVMVGAYVAPDPTASVRLEIMDWNETPFILAADKQSASLTIEDIHKGNYAFKMFINGEWRSNAGTISRENPAAIVAGNEEGNMTLHADIDGIYTFTWFFANDSLVALFPEKPVVPMTEIRLVPGVWNVDGAKFAAVTWNEGEVMEDGVVSDWFVGTDTVVGNIPAAADSIGFARFNGEAAAPSIEDQSIIWNHTDKMLIDKETMIYTITGWPEEGKDYCPGYWGAPYVPVLENGFYLVGNKYNWTPAAERLFTANPETEGEYFLAEVTLEENDSIKVVMVVNDEITDWYPNGDNYVVDAAHAGVKDIYFNPTYQEAWGNNIYIEANAAPFACDWNNIAWLDGSNEQIKVCHENPMMKVVNVQNPHWSATTEDGIYMTFPSAVWGEISLPEGKYEIQGAGLLVYLSALTQEYNEISIVCQDVEYIINIYNAANAPKPVYYLVGTLNEWTASEAYKFGVDETCAEGEYILHATLTTGDEIKVIGVLGTDTTWYPAEAGNYNIDDAHAGEAKAIYFRPQYHADWAAFGGYFWIGENQALLDAPDAAPAAPTYAGYQVHAAYSATYNADCNFGEWGSGTQYTQEEFGKKYVTTNLGYFGLEFTGMDCSEMETLHLDVWVAADASIRIVPIHGGTEVGVTAQLQGQQWNAIDIALTEFAGVTNWSNVYQIKIDNASNLTFWLNNVYFYTTQEKTVDLVDGYYLIGTMNGWDIHNLTADHLFAVNPENEAEYKLHYTLAEGNEFKVVAVANNELGAWYPGEAGNYVVDFAHAGENDIYFRPDYQGGADWHASCIYVAVDESQVNPWETWFATGDTWNTETESYLEWDGENQKATIHINVDKYGQWRAQVKYHGPVAEAGKCYRVALKLKSNNAINNVTIKYQDNAEMIYVNNAALEANVEYVFDEVAAGIAGGNGIMVLDFGFAHAGDIIEIYDVVIEETECPATRLEDGFYLIGLGMADWTVDYITADYLFTANPSNEGEYMLNITLAKDQQFKVVSVANDAIVTWYPDGMDNNYIVDENHYGATTVYFRPDGQGGEGWHYGMIYVAPVDHTAIDTIDANAPAVKILRDGQILIIKGSKTFNAQGQLVK